MRRRVLTLLLLLLSGLLTAVLVPLVQSYAAQRSQDFHITRLNDTARFAALSEDALRTDRRRLLQEEIIRYDQLYNVAVAIVDVNGGIVASSRSSINLTDPAVAERVDHALAGRTGERPPVIWPWHRSRHVIVEPVGRDSQVLGAVVTLSATDAVREDVYHRLLLLTTLGLGASAVLALLVALPLTRWVIRPVHNLEAAVHEIAQGHLDVRVPISGGPAELRGLASSFNVMADSVAASLEQQRVFVADASHQLRNPVAALRLRVENLQAYIDGDGRAELRETLGDTERLARLVDSLLRLARAEATRAERVPIDICACVRERLENWRPLLGNTALLLDLPGRRTALARRDVVEQILDILVDNATKFAAGSQIEISVGRTGQDVVLRVRDGGPGLSDDDLPRVGERFFRSRVHQNVPGTGLGLAIARELAQHSGGGLEVARAQPAGLAVTVRLPAASPWPRGSSEPRRDAVPEGR